jgi:hypothetical protein
MKTAAYASDRSSESSDWLSHGGQLAGRSFGPQAERDGTGGIDLLKGPVFAGGMPVRAKLTIGEPNDKYEQEADRVAEQVMNTPDGAVQREGLPEEEEELQMKPVIQREELPEEEDELQMKPLIQREGLPEEEEELQMKPVIQREELPEEEEGLQMKPVIQREELPEEEEELQMKADSSGRQVPVATGAFEDRLNGSKGGGSPLSEDVRSFMEPRFGADFSGVRVHTGGEAVQMNREVGAQAFAHGQDVYYGAGKGPGKDALTAHELTHVVQQTGSLSAKQATPVIHSQTYLEQRLPLALQRKPKKPKGDADTIVDGQPLDPEIQREIDIGHAAANALTRAKLYLKGHATDVTAAINLFKESAQSQIDSLEGDPSDYWALLPTLAGLVGATLTVWIPGVNIAVGAALAVAVQAAVQTGITAETKQERGDSKKQAKQAMQAFAESVEIGQSKGGKKLNEQISNEMLTLSVTDENVRMLLAVGDDKSLDQVISASLGIPDPEKKSPFEEVLKSLNVQFAEWITRKQLNSDRTGLEKMLIETPGTDKYKEYHEEDQRKMTAAKETAERQAKEAAEKRGK